ncbi:unnamed protein product [Prunus brigantina]
MKPDFISLKTIPYGTAFVHIHPHISSGSLSFNLFKQDVNPIL